MSNLKAYLDKRGVTEPQMEKARALTQAKIEAYNLKEARRANHMTQVELAKAMGVSQKRISCMDDGIGAQSFDAIRR